MSNFIKYYSHSLFSKWWIFVIATPNLLPKTLDLYTFYFPYNEADLATITNLLVQYKQYFPWLLLLSFILANILVSFDLWSKLKKTEEESVSTGLNDDYEAIADLIREISPTKYDGFVKKLKTAYKYYTKQSSMNNIICTHFSVYRLIDEILKDCYKERTIIRSTSTSLLIETFTDNYKEINRLNDEIGKNNSINTDINFINKLIRDTHDNLRSILSYYSK